MSGRRDADTHYPERTAGNPPGRRREGLAAAEDELRQAATRQLKRKKALRGTVMVQSVRNEEDIRT